MSLAPLADVPDTTRSRLAVLLERGRLLLSAGVIALAATAAPSGPARAQNADDVLAFILGAAAVAVILRSYDNQAQAGWRPRPGLLPDACLERVRLNRRDIDFYHAACLGWYGISRLPARCETRLRTNVGLRRYFLAQCLYEANYRPERGWSSRPQAWDSPGAGSRPRSLPPYVAPEPPRRDWQRHRPDDRRDWRRGDRDDNRWSGRERRERGERSERGNRPERGDRPARGERHWNGGNRRGGERGTRERGRDSGGGERGSGAGADPYTHRGP